MNIFRLAGDMTHLLSILTLLLKIQATRSCRGKGYVYAMQGADLLNLDVANNTQVVLFAGISLKTQELYAVVFVCRYLDLFTRWVSL